MSTSAPRVELVLPLLVTNDERGSDLLRARDGLVASINHFCDPEFVSRLAVIVPREDLAAAAPLERACRIKVDIIAESELVPVERIGAIPRRGWFLQQLIKLAYNKHCATEFYITLDADIFLINPLNASVIRDGKAPAKYEHAEAHRGWWEASVKTLALPISAIDVDPERVFGVTPAFLKTSIVAAAIDRLNDLGRKDGRQDWIEYLCGLTSVENNCWTEYSLYWTYLVNNFGPSLYYYPHDLYLYSHYTWHVARTIMARDANYPQLFSIIQSSQVDDQTFAQFVGNFLSSRSAVLTLPPP